MSEFSGPLFIVGMPRSGTKLLRNLLNQHSRIRIPAFETEFLPYLAAQHASYGDLTQSANFQRFYANITRLPFFTYQRNTGGLVGIDDWRDACPSFDVAGIFEGLVRAHTKTQQRNDVIWGDKSPSYIGHIPLIASLYAEARIVHIVRDVRDHCLSMRGAWGKNMYRAAERWSDGVVGASKAGEAIPGRFIEVRYEDLIVEPERVLNEICTFLSIKFEPAVLTVAAPTESQGDTQGQKRIVAQNHGKYRTKLPPKTCKRIEELAFRGMQRFKYPPEHATEQHQSLAVQRGWWLTLDAINLARSGIARRGLFSNIAFHTRHFRQTRSSYSSDDSTKG